MSNFDTPGDIRARVRWMREALGELEDELDKLEELIDEPSGRERERRGVWSPSCMGRIWEDFSSLGGQRGT